MNRGPSIQVFVVGMGPAGLAAAILAAQKGFSVMIADPRVEITRGQRVQIDNNTVQFLTSLKKVNDLQDDEFFNRKLSRNGEVTVELKDIQKYLLRKLSLYPAITTRQGYRVESIDPNFQKLTIKKVQSDIEEKISFAHLAAADGSHHEVANLLNAHGDARFKIHHEKIIQSLQPRNPESGTITLQVMPNQTLPPRPAHVNKFRLSDMPRLKKYGWNQPYFPKVYVFSNQSNTKLFVSGEIPKSIYLMKNKEEQRRALVSWGNLMANILLGYNVNQLRLVEKESKTNPTKASAKNKLKTTAFQLELYAADKGCVNLGQNGSFTLLGDAFKNANFFFSHGVNDAILDAQKFVTCLSYPQQCKMDEVAFNEHQQKQLKKLIQHLRMANEPSDMPKTMQQLEECVVEMMDFATSLSKHQFKEIITKVKNHQLHIHTQMDVESFYTDVKYLISEIKKYLESKLQSASCLRHIFGKNYAEKIRLCDDLTEKVVRLFSKYYDLNVKQDPNVPLLDINPATLSAAGVIYRVYTARSTDDAGKQTALPLLTECHAAPLLQTRATSSKCALVT